jgi:hypothetical protein
MPTDDPLFGKGIVRQDGRKIHPMYLFEVKKPSESKGPWDFYKVLATIPAAEAFRPLDKGDCPVGPRSSPMRRLYRKLAAVALGSAILALVGVWAFPAAADAQPARPTAWVS